MSIGHTSETSNTILSQVTPVHRAGLIIVLKCAQVHVG